MNILKTAELHTFEWLKMEGQDRWKKVSIFLVEESSWVTMGEKAVVLLLAKRRRPMPTVDLMNWNWRELPTPGACPDFCHQSNKS